jgi:adenylate cyclase
LVRQVGQVGGRFVRPRGVVGETNRHLDEASGTADHGLAWTTSMEHASAPKLSAEELGVATGEPVERLRRFRSLNLIGSEDDERFAPADVERVRLIQFLERRQIALETIAQAEREQAVLTSVVDFLFPHGVRRMYSFAEAIDIVGLDADVARRLREVSSASDEVMDEHDLRMLRQAKVGLDAGFPETALLQLARVYADALGRVAEAEVHLFHFYVHEGLKTAGLSGRELLDSRKAVREHLLPIVEPMIRYFHHRGMAKAVREDMILHLTADPVRPSQDDSRAKLRLAIVFLDVSSYTPMTEVMGDAVAARIVERLSALVREATIRHEGRIVDRVGDAFLLIFPDPRAAVTCALQIERRTAAEPQFPALRAAVHWGDLLYLEGGYVGTSLNIASRVATQARPHQILATAAVHREIGGLSGVQFAPLGTRRLKGLAEEVELFEVRADEVQGGQRIRDPVCGIEMAPTEVAATLVVRGRELAFCCERCLRVFLEAPQRYEE